MCAEEYDSLRQAAGTTEHELTVVLSVEETGAEGTGLGEYVFIFLVFLNAEPWGDCALRDTCWSAEVLLRCWREME